MTMILMAALVLGGLGLLFGLLLTLANKVFEVPSDPRRDAVRNCLPGANCGGCGYAGCDALADAIAQGKAPVNACPVGGAAVAKQVAEIMGVEDAPPKPGTLPPWFVRERWIAAKPNFPITAFRTVWPPRWSTMAIGPASMPV